MYFCAASQLNFNSQRQNSFISFLHPGRHLVSAKYVFKGPILLNMQPCARGTSHDRGPLIFFNCSKIRVTEFTIVSASSTVGSTKRVRDGLSPPSELFPSSPTATPHPPNSPRVPRPLAPAALLPVSLNLAPLGTSCKWSGSTCPCVTGCGI